MILSEAPEIVRLVWSALESSEGVDGLSLGGSRAKGYATELSDWDLFVEGHPDRLMSEIPDIIAAFGPLAAFWEPLSEQAAYMTVMDGPVKIDLFPKGGVRAIQPPWVLRREALGAIDGHFWDWMLWLGGKALRGEAELVTKELHKMHAFLLGPLGVEPIPAHLQDAVVLYLDARREASQQLGGAVSDELGRQVLQNLRRHRLVN